MTKKYIVGVLVVVLPLVGAACSALPVNKMSFRGDGVSYMNFGTSVHCSRDADSGAARVIYDGITGDDDEYTPWYGEYVYANGYLNLQVNLYDARSITATQVPVVEENGEYVFSAEAEKHDGEIVPIAGSFSCPELGK